jgi:tRNA pseudouridine38-40 synthase
MGRYRATVAYDGTHYFGFQRQVASQPTVQAQLEIALSRLASGPVTITGAGRTDTGVHARGQVISFELAWRHGTDALRRACNANLPADIAVLAVEEADPDFHPRFDARQRAYEYCIYNSPTRHPLHRLYSWHVRRPLEMEPMRNAAQRLIGVHDFATFGQPTQGESTVREVMTIDWQRREGSFLVLSIVANAFLYRMVRSIVGALVAIGQGAWTVSEFVDAFEARDRARAARTAPPQGLSLVFVAYD